MKCKVEHTTAPPASFHAMRMPWKAIAPTLLWVPQAVYSEIEIGKQRLVNVRFAPKSGHSSAH